MSETRKKILTALAVVGITYNLFKFLKYLKWRNNLIKTYKIPPSSVFLGNILTFVEAGGFNEKFFSKLHQDHGRVAGFFLFPNLFNMSIQDSDLVHDLYSKARSRPPETYMFLNYIGDDNLLFTHGPMVKEIRLRYGKMVSSREQLEKINRISQVEFDKVFSRWATMSSVDVFQETGATIYDIVGQALFEGPWSNSAIGKEIYATHKYLIQNVNKFMILPWLQPIGYSKYLGMKRKWRSLCNSLLESRRKEMEADPKKFEKDESALTLLLTEKDKSGKPFFSESLRISTMCGFLNGAYDTTHATSFWLMYNLCSFPEEQEKLRNEIKKKLGDSYRPFTVDELREIQYLDAFIKESMRMYSTVPVNQRLHVTEDIVLSAPGVEDVPVPKGVCVNIPNGVIMKDPALFGKDVDAFRPDRFLDPSPQGDKARKAWLQFGGSTRMCVGTTFALVELKMFVTALLTQYRISFADKEDCYTDKMIEAGVNQPEKKVQMKVVQI